MRSGICWPHVGREALALDYCPAAMVRRNSNAPAPHGFTKIPPTCSDILMKSVLVVDAVLSSIGQRAEPGLKITSSSRVGDLAEAERGLPKCSLLYALV